MLWVKATPDCRFWKNTKHLPLLEALTKWKTWSATHVPKFRTYCGPTSKDYLKAAWLWGHGSAWCPLAHGESVLSARIEWIRLKIITEAIQSSCPTTKQSSTSPKATASLLAGCFTASLSLSYLLSVLGMPQIAGSKESLPAPPHLIISNYLSQPIKQNPFFRNPARGGGGGGVVVSELLLYFCQARTDTQNVLTSLRCKTHCFWASIFKSNVSKASISWSQCFLWAPLEKKGI